MDLVEVEEGSTKFLVPRQDPSSTFPPGSAPVFYNQRMELNRDATVLFISVTRPSEYLDAMGATGVRGLRVAGECGVRVTINDRNPYACDIIRKNTEVAAGVIQVTCQNIHSLLAEKRYDALDLDPFGSPAPFIDSAIRGTGRFLMVTATDTAPLCGAHHRAGIRRYFSSPKNNEYHAETGLRTLLGFIVRETVKYDRGIEPLFCYAREHYIRLHLRLHEGVKPADRSIGNVGYIYQCVTCPERDEKAGLIPVPGACPECGGKMLPIGPLWLGTIQDSGILSKMKNELPATPLKTTRHLEPLLEILEEELPTSTHFDYHVLAKIAKVSPAPLAEVIQSLKELGFFASRAHYSGTSIKTDAPVPEIITVLRGKQK